MLQQPEIDRFIEFISPNCHHIIDDIQKQNKTPEKTLILKIIKEYKDQTTPFLLNYISNKLTHPYSTNDVCNIILYIYQHFHDKMLIYMEQYGTTPRGFRQSQRKWKLNDFNNIGHRHTKLQ
jgi:hypothetical protein